MKSFNSRRIFVPCWPNGSVGDRVQSNTIMLLLKIPICPFIVAWPECCSRLRLADPAVLAHLTSHQYSRKANGYKLVHSERKVTGRRLVSSGIHGKRKARKETEGRVRRDNYLRYMC